jgi:hypothetical protein
LGNESLQLPNDPQCERLVKQFGPECVLEDEIIWRRIKHRHDQNRLVIFLPTTLISKVIQEAQGEMMSEHDGGMKTKERFLQCYY